jgi:hypothetical protein
VSLVTHLLESAQFDPALQDVIDTRPDLVPPSRIDLRPRRVVLGVKAGEKTMRHKSALVQIELETRP